MTLRRSAPASRALRLAPAAFALAATLLVGTVPAYAADDAGASVVPSDPTVSPSPSVAPTEQVTSAPEDAPAPADEASPGAEQLAPGESTIAPARDPEYGTQLVTISAELEAGTVAPAGTGSIDEMILQISIDNGTAQEAVLCGMAPGIPTPGADEVLPVCPSATTPFPVPAGWTFRAQAYRVPPGLVVRGPGTQEVPPCLADGSGNEGGLCNKTTNLRFVLGLPIVQAPTASPTPSDSATPVPRASAAATGPRLAETGGTDMGLALAGGLALCGLGGAIIARRRFARG